MSRYDPRMMVLRLIRRLALFLSLVLLAAPAGAQIWIGEFAARRAHEAREWQRQRACEARLPPSDALVAKASARSTDLVAMLQALSAKAPHREYKTLFAKPKGAKVILDPLILNAQAHGASQRLSFVVGTDASTAVGIWHLGTTDGKARTYLMQFAYVPISLFRSDWRIARIVDVPSGSAIPALSPYCRIEQVAALGVSSSKH